jgi:hypothetical protein
MAAIMLEIAVSQPSFLPPPYHRLQRARRQKRSGTQLLIPFLVRLGLPRGQSETRRPRGITTAH